MRRDWVAWAGCMVFGAIVWLAIAAATGRSEAWDSSAYFSIGVPAVAIVAFAAGFLVPERSWRWGIAPVAGQFVAMLIMQGPGNLLPLGVIVFAVLSIPSMITARLGASLASRWSRG